MTHRSHLRSGLHASSSCRWSSYFPTLCLLPERISARNNATSRMAETVDLFRNFPADGVRRYWAGGSGGAEFLLVRPQAIEFLGSPERDPSPVRTSGLYGAGVEVECGVHSRLKSFAGPLSTQSTDSLTVRESHLSKTNRLSHWVIDTNSIACRDSRSRSFTSGKIPHLVKRWRSFREIEGLLQWASICSRQPEMSLCDRCSLTFAPEDSA